MPQLSNRKGFAMPMAIFVIAVLTAALAAGFSGATTEMTTNTAVRAQNRAYQLAETGLEQFVVRRADRDPVTFAPWCQNCGDPVTADSEWTRVSLPGGYADVVAVKVRPVIGAQNAVYFIRSKGVDTTKIINRAAGTRYAERTVGIYATWNTTTIDVKAAWLSLSGLSKQGTGVISGIDDCGQQPSIAGVMVDKGDLDVDGNAFYPLGNPPVDTSNTFTQLKAKTNIDWASVLQNSIAADIEIPGGSFPTAAQFDADTTYWPVIRIHTNGYALPNRGRGMIIADSDFVINGSNMWNGIILVGEQLISDGNNTVAGATLSGLNFLVNGQTPTLTTQSQATDNSTANGQKTYVYNSCYVSRAAQRLRRYVTMPNSWMDNLTSW
jgi:hypothetical protein